jgi:hypothetical protein
LSSPSVNTVPPEVAASQLVFQLSTGYIASSALYVAVKLHIADRLADGPRAVADLAGAAGANEDALYRVLRSLSSLGVFEEVSPRTFANNLASSTMRSEAPGSTHPMTLWVSDPFHFRVYADMMHSVITGTPAAEKTVGMPVFEYFQRDAELSEVFNDAMTAFSAFVVPAALEVYDFSGIGLLVDVAGGHGQLLTSILEKHPQMRGILFDVAHVIAGAIPRLEQAGLSGRCSTATGDFFKAVPAGGDAYLMKHIIHDWDDERALKILANIRSAMNPGGRIILLESVLASSNEPDFGKLIDLEMLVMPGGRERTADEFRALFQRAGFTVTKIVSTKSPLSVIEAM